MTKKKGYLTPKKTRFCYKITVRVLAEAELRNHGSWKPGIPELESSDFNVVLKLFVS